MKFFKTLVDQGNTVIVIEHNLDVAKVADRIIDLGPDGGKQGRVKLSLQGMPEEVAGQKRSYTGQYLKKFSFMRPYPGLEKNKH